MTDMDRNAAGKDRQLQPVRPKSEDPPRAARIVVIEPRTWLRECLVYALTTDMSDLSIEGVASANEVVPGPARLLLIGLDPRSGRDPARLRETFETLRRVGAGSPIGAYLHADDAALAASLVALGVAGIVLPSAGVEVAVASVRLMAAGGTFLPVELMTQTKEIAAPALQPPAAPETAALPPAPLEGELTSPRANLTARERDVLASLRAGRANKAIAHDLRMSESTVKVHLRSIMKKLRATNRTQAALRYGEAKIDATRS